ncbi:MAG: sarcosine oxidase subunit gamma [Alkalilacustris sp.]
MAELIANGGPGGGLAAVEPIEAAGCTLELLDLGPVAAIQPWPGRTGAVDTALKARGLGFPAPGRSLEVADTRILWAGRETAFLIGTAPPALSEAAVTDLTDGWAGVLLLGERAAEVLARLVPVDLRPRACPEGTALRTLLGHVPCLILRRGGGFEVMVMRSFLSTAWHELATALRQVAARRAAQG